MENTEIVKLVRKNASAWLSDTFDAETRKQVQYLMDNDESELIESFYRSLEFGTAGLRGTMGVGTNRMNIYTVGMATQGLCNYLKKNYPNLPQIKVAIAHDCRNNGRLFAETTANIFSANGIKVYLFESLRPTPELSFAIRYFGCQSGVVITASHNPKEYNGFKAFGEDGGQYVDPDDVNVVEEVNKIAVQDVKFEGNPALIEIVGNEVDEAYLEKIKSITLSPELIAKHHDLKIVYTPIHGTGVKLIPAVLRKFGFTNVSTVAEQEINDGNFPTVISPNPENAEALKMAIEKAQAIGADLVMASDPDADRVGIAVRNSKGEFVLMNGNQTISVLLYYLITKWADNQKLTGNEYIVHTIVTTDLIAEMAKKYNIEAISVLTGFKYIGEAIRLNEGKKQFIAGGEESYGYLEGDFVRDKDAVMSCAMIAETAAWAAEQGKTLYDVLLDIYKEYGLYADETVNIDKKGKAGAEEIQRMMKEYRENPPQEINGSKVLRLKDYLLRKEKDLTTGLETDIILPKSNVLQFFLEDGSKISVRPSGTEPKIKFYFSVKAELNEISQYEKVSSELANKIQTIITSMNLK